MNMIIVHLLASTEPVIRYKTGCIYWMKNLALLKFNVSSKKSKNVTVFNNYSLNETPVAGFRIIPTQSGVALTGY